jgi:hypothetical protein
VILKGHPDVGPDLDLVHPLAPVKRALWRMLRREQGAIPHLVIIREGG